MDTLRQGIVDVFAAIKAVQHEKFGAFEKSADDRIYGFASTCETDDWPVRPSPRLLDIAERIGEIRRTAVWWSGVAHDTLFDLAVTWGFDPDALDEDVQIDSVEDIGRILDRLNSDSTDCLLDRMSSRTEHRPDCRYTSLFDGVKSVQSFMETLHYIP